MKYGLTRTLQVYGIENGIGSAMLATAGDYLQSQLWCQKNIDLGNDGANELVQTYAWAWYALRRNGKLAEYGIPEEISRDALFEMMDKATVYLEAVKDDSLPLAGSATPPKS